MKSLALLAALCICCFSIAQKRAPIHTRAVKRTTGYLGQWYDATAKGSRTPWLGFRICNVPKGKLTVQGSSYSLPFPQKGGVGRNWVRLGREKGGCDVVLVKASTAKNGQTCSWKITSSGGGAVAQGSVKINSKTMQPFAPPQWRLKR